MNRALWSKALSDAWRLWAGSCALLVLFAWVFVWFTSLFQLGAWGAMLGALPNSLQAMFPVPIARLASPLGQISVIFVHPIAMLVMLGWAIARGSDPISGEIGRGTMDLILTLPARRFWILLVPAIVGTLGAALLAGALLLGIAIGISTVKLPAAVPLGPLVSGAVNLFAMSFCMMGLTALLSAPDRNRWRTMALAGGVFIVAFVIRIVGRVWKTAPWVEYFTFLTAFEPQQLILMPDPRIAWWYNGTLLGLGLAGYLMAGIILSYRDIPQSH